MDTINDIMEAQKLSPRVFTYKQLSKISDDNYGILNRSIDMSFFKKDDVFVLEPVMIHRHAFGEPVKSHLRTKVSVLLNGKKRGAFQDMTFEQWEQGAELNQTTTSLKPNRLAS